MAFRVRGGLRIPRGNASWPLASLACTADQLRIGSPFGRLLLDRADVEGVTAYRGFLSRGVQIFIKDGNARFGAPIFWYRKVDQLMVDLEELGWPVKR